ncbi:unnamed protein product [Cyclocybe aegerita]|uniref:SHSP domain-containing protein n=1 Tax=Cyclocybe aegerita TaxID=1973307 RepID=A0A8S0VU20_CYCAE|nr:unnamed protein product [Cyclocybe aegerita]
MTFMCFRTTKVSTLYNYHRFLRLLFILNAMSLARQFFREMRPLFRMVEEPLSRPPAYYPLSRRIDPFENFFADARPAIDIHDQGDKYVVDADLPGVKKEDIQVRVGEDGRSITIEGQVVETNRLTTSPVQTENTSEGLQAGGDATTVTKTDDTSTQISSERQFTRNTSFARTVWLPRPIDASNVSAKLNDGVLSITINKAVEKLGTTIPIED